MRKSRKAVRRRDRLITAGLSLLSGLGALTAAAALLSAAAVFCDLSDSAVKGLSGIALAAGCFACSFCAANRRRRKGLATGFFCGAAVFCAVVIIGALTVKMFSAAGLFTKLFIIAAASALGGFKGVNTRPVFRE